MQLSTVCVIVAAAWSFFHFRILSHSNSRRGSVLSASSLKILASVLQALVNANSINSWRGIFSTVKGDIREELRRLSAEQNRNFEQLKAQLRLHQHESEEIDWANIPARIFHNRNDRRKALLATSKRAMRIKERRVLHYRALWYMRMLEEGKRGQPISYWEIIPALKMCTYFILLWVIDVVFALVWALLALFEPLVVDSSSDTWVQ
ncbi:hypothetical protein FPCIR_11103 [Fusarium pseudocircinatum]|uniref:Uncharacterized protein n=1 Tax=Fusarium pseudocircinatum TaxID=56676 RepID=A0A8H5NXP2_9HYPO|nr:hypothetical protein FPCIR_11103 [Fusarium pseudocircinatum]